MSVANLNQVRRVTQTAYGHTVFVTPPKPMPHAEWAAWFEKRALSLGYIAVIDGRVIDHSTAQTDTERYVVPVKAEGRS